MSKIARIPVVIKEGVNVDKKDGTVVVSGPKGTLEFHVPSDVQVQIAEGKVTFSAKENAEDGAKALLGLTRATIANMVAGVSVGFEKKLELSGVGYRAQTNGTELTLFLGYSHPVVIKADKGITFSVVEGAIVISGTDKMLVGNMAAKIRAVRPPEPYKGKGIKYQGERIRRKAGKAAKAVGGK